MRSILWIAALAVTGITTGPAMADVVARINLAAQQMTVSVDGAVRHVWPVSTARRGYTTPLGSYRPIRLERSWYSCKYNNSPMPYAIFFKGGYAIHGTNETAAIGMPVSHGCVRLRTENARTLFQLAKEYGSGHTRIVVARSGPAYDATDRAVDRRAPGYDRGRSFDRFPNDDDFEERPRRRPFFFPFFPPGS